MKISRYAVVLIGLVLTASACAVGNGEPSGSGDSVEEPASASTLVAVEPTQPISTANATQLPLDSVDAVRDHLATSESVAHSEVELQLQQEVTWPNGAIGCPEPGMSYTQALVDGSRLVFTVRGTEYEFHSAQGGHYFYCENPGEPTGGSPDA
jgi:hypothetical protein